MEEYSTYTLEDLSIGKGSYGIAASAVPFDTSLHTYLRITDINDDGTLNKSGLMSVNEDEARKYLLEPNDIVFARTGNSTGRSYFYDGSDGELVYAGFLIKFSLDSAKVNPRILKYYTHSKPYYDWVQSFGTGSTRGNINAKTYGNMPITLPPRDIQDKIVDVLKSLDDKIEVNRRINDNFYFAFLEVMLIWLLTSLENDNLEQQAQTLFKSWLSLCKYEVTIGDLSMNITDYTKCDQKEVVLINSSDVTEGYFTHHNLSKNENLKGHFKKRFTKGDILYSQVRPRNRHWGYCTFDAENYLASTQLMVIRNKKDIVPSILLYQYLIDDNVWMDFTLKTETRSGTFPQGNYEDLSSIKVPFGADINDISMKLKSLYTLLFNNEEESRCLAELRDTLLPRLMSGELKVNEIENAI